MAELEEVWGQVLEALRGQMTQATFDTWLRGSTVVEGGEGTLTVGVRHAYALDWLENRLMPVVQRATTAVAGRQMQVRFVVAGPVEGAPVVDQVDDDEVLVEAVREDRVDMRPGGSLAWTDFYIKLKVAFRKRALRELKGGPLSVFLCLALHVDRDGVASPGIDTIMRETGYSRSVVCNALEDLVRSGIVSKRAAFRGADEYMVNGYAWFGQAPAPALWEEASARGK